MTKSDLSPSLRKQCRIGISLFLVSLVIFLAGTGLLIASIVGITPWLGVSETLSCKISSVQGTQSCKSGTCTVYGVTIAGADAEKQALSWTGTIYSVGDSEECTFVNNSMSALGCCSSSWQYNRVLWLDWSEEGWYHYKNKFLKFSISGGVMVFLSALIGIVAIFPMLGPLNTYYPLPGEGNQRGADNDEVNITLEDYHSHTRGKDAKKPNAQNININDPKSEKKKKKK